MIGIFRSTKKITIINIVLVIIIIIIYHHHSESMLCVTSFSFSIINSTEFDHEHELLENNVENKLDKGFIKSISVERAIRRIVTFHF